MFFVFLSLFQSCHFMCSVLTHVLSLHFLSASTPLFLCQYLIIPNVPHKLSSVPLVYLNCPFSSRPVPDCHVPLPSDSLCMIRLIFGLLFLTHARPLSLTDHLNLACFVTPKPCDLETFACRLNLLYLILLSDSSVESNSELSLSHICGLKKLCLPAHFEEHGGDTRRLGLHEKNWTGLWKGSRTQQQERFLLKCVQWKRWSCEKGLRS